MTSQVLKECKQCGKKMTVSDTLPTDTVLGCPACKTPVQNDTIVDPTGVCKGEGYSRTFVSNLGTNPKDLLGTDKVPLSRIPPVSLLHLGMAMGNGGDKYGPYNWRGNAVQADIYIDAAMRHLLAWFDGEEFAEDSGVHHLGHAMACCAILLDAQATGNLKDNRPPGGKAAEVLKVLNETRKQQRATMKEKKG